MVSPTGKRLWVEKNGEEYYLQQWALTGWKAEEEEEIHSHITKSPFPIPYSKATVSKHFSKALFWSHKCKTPFQSHQIKAPLPKPPVQSPPYASWEQPLLVFHFQVVDSLLQFLQQLLDYRRTCNEMNQSQISVDTSCMPGTLIII